MANRYAAVCYRCGQIVPPGEGMFEKITAVQRKKWPNITGKWHVQHHECANKYRGTRKHYLHAPDVLGVGDERVSQ